MSSRQGREIGPQGANAAEAVMAFKALALGAGYLFEVDAPANTAAEWFIDVEQGAFQESLSWLSGRGFGFYTGEVGYGDKPNELYLDATQAFERLEQLHVRREGGKAGALNLADLRQLLHMSQSEVASLGNLKQAAISRFEGRGDVLLSSLMSYLEALGGKLELRVHFDRMDVSLGLPAPARKQIRSA
jgi:hypothetical protein